MRTETDMLPGHLRAKISRICNRSEAPPQARVTPEFTRGKLLKAGAPVDAVEALDSLDDALDAMTAAQEFLSDRKARFLLLLGDKGVGKTTAAVAVMQDAVRRFPWNEQPSGSGIIREPCRLVPAHRLTQVSAFEDDSRALLAECERVPLLVLDDVGDEATELGLSALRAMLLERYANARRTVLTGNLKREAFKRRYGEALADRIRESGLIPVLSGPSLRKPRGAP